MRYGDYTGDRYQGGIRYGNDTKRSNDLHWRNGFCDNYHWSNFDLFTFYKWGVLFPMTDDQKSIVVDVQMPRGEKKFALQFDRILRDCTQDCRKFALQSGIGKGDEVYYTVNAKDQYSYLKKTGQHFDLKEQPQPATAPIIDAEKEQRQFVEPPRELSRINHEVHRSEIIMWEALLNTAVKIVEQSGPYLDDEPRDVAKMVKDTAVDLHTFIMEKVDGTRSDPYYQNERERTHP